jgi:hypothetical protein
VLRRIRYPFTDLFAFLAAPRNLPDLKPVALKQLRVIVERGVGRDELDLLVHNLALYVIFGLGIGRESHYFRQTLKNAYGADSPLRADFGPLLDRFRLFGEVLAGKELNADEIFLEAVEDDPRLSEVMVRFEAFYHNGASPESLGRRALDEPVDLDLSRVISHALLRLTSQGPSRDRLQVEQWDHRAIEEHKVLYIRRRFGAEPFYTARVRRFLSQLTPSGADLVRGLVVPDVSPVADAGRRRGEP